MAIMLDLHESRYPKIFPKIGKFPGYAQQYINRNKGFQQALSEYLVIPSVLGKETTKMLVTVSMY